LVASYAVNVARLCLFQCISQQVARVCRRLRSMPHLGWRRKYGRGNSA
jgi:hypothetical protein